MVVAITSPHYASTGCEMKVAIRTRIHKMHRLRSLLTVALVVGTGTLVPASAAGTILGTVDYQEGPAEAYAWGQSGKEGICHLLPDSVNGWNGWSSVGLPFTETRWRCTYDGKDVEAAGIPVGATVDFKKLELQAIQVSGCCSYTPVPNMDTDYPREITRIRWDVGQDGVFEADEALGWPRGQQPLGGESDALGSRSWWGQAHYLRFSHRFEQVGHIPIALIANYDDGSDETATGVIPVVADTVTPKVSADRFWYVAGQQIALTSAGSTSLSGSLSGFRKVSMRARW